MRFRKWVFQTFIFTVLFFSLQTASSGTGKKPVLKNQDNRSAVGNLVIFGKDHGQLTDWFTGWGKDAHEADIKTEGDDAVITGALKERSFAAVHKNLTFNIDLYPEVEITVKAVSSSWYFIVSGGQVKDGYVKLQPDTQNTGVFRYNLKKLLRLSGDITVDLQLGVSIPDGKRCDGETVTFSSLVLIADQQAFIKPSGTDRSVVLPSVEPLDLLAEGQSVKGLGDWLAHRQGQGDESLVSRDSGNLSVEGVLEDRNFAAAFKNVAVNIDEHPVLQIDVVSSVKNWFVILSGPLFKEGYVRVQPDTDKTGLFSYNLKNLFGLSGKVAFDIQLGVSDPGGKSCKGIKVTVKRMVLAGNGK